MKVKQKMQFEAFRAQMKTVACDKCGKRGEFTTAGSNSHMLRARCVCGKVLKRERVLKDDVPTEPPTSTRTRTVFETVDGDD